MAYYKVDIMAKSGGYYYYTHAKDICELAKYLNSRVGTSLMGTVLSVLALDSPFLDDNNELEVGELVQFLDTEFAAQKFIETYEERLLATHKERNHV